MIQAASEQGSVEGRLALETLCDAYWYPLYVYVRRQGHDFHSAQDLTQEFFTTLLTKNRLQAVDRDRGRFRTFLLAALRNFLINDWRDARAAKRGGGKLPVSIDFASGETRYSLEPKDSATPESSYERRWALAILDRALEKMHQEFVARGKEELFTALKPYLNHDDDAANYAATAEALSQPKRG